MIVERSLLVPFSEIFKYSPLALAFASQKKILLSICEAAGASANARLGDPARLVEPCASRLRIFHAPECHLHVTDASPDPCCDHKRSASCSAGLAPHTPLVKANDMHCLLY